jgi:YVTN family beta-propeller protein
LFYRIPNVGWKPFSRRLAPIVLLAVLLGAGYMVPLARASSTPAIQGVSTIAVGSNPDGLAFDPFAYSNRTTGAVFVSARSTDSIAVISDTSNSIVGNFSVPLSPVGIAYDSSKDELFVAGDNPSRVSVISPSTHKVIANISMGQNTGPLQAAYDPPRGEIFVSEYAASVVSVISDSSNQVVANIGVISDPTALAYDSSKGEIFVTNSGPDSVVSVISDASNKVVANISAGPSPEGVAYDPARGEVFVGNEGNSVSVISDSSNKVVATISGAGGAALAYDSQKGLIFVSGSAVSVISDSTNRVVATFPVGQQGGYGETSIAYDILRGEVFVPNVQTNQVSIISDSAIVLNAGTTSSGTTSSSSNGPTSTGTSTSSSGNGSGSSSIPEFPYQATATFLVVVGIVGSYLAVRGRTKNEPTSNHGR